MTRVPTTATDPLRATQVTGNGIRGEKSPAATPAGDFLQSLLSFSSGRATQAITSDLRFNQLVGALQLNRPDAGDDFGRLESRREGSSLDNSPADPDNLPDDDPDSDRDTAANRRHSSAEVWAELERRSDPLWVAPTADPRLGQTGIAIEHGSAGSLSEVVGLERFANQRSEGFPTADRAAAIELARRESLEQAGEAFDSLNGRSIDRVALRRDRGSNLAGSEGGLRLEGAWQRVAGGETLVGGLGRAPGVNTAVTAAVTDLQQPGQLDAVSDALNSERLSRSVTEASETEPGWQLSFQSDRTGVRSGRLNSGTKAKAREGLKPDGAGPVEGAYRLGPVGPSAQVARQDLTLRGPVVRHGSQLSLDELSVAPAAARALWESGLGGTVVTAGATVAGVTTEVMTNLAVSATSGSGPTAGSQSSIESPGLPPTTAIVESTTSDLALSGVANRGDMALAVDADGAVPELAGAPRTLPARVLTQVAQALRDAPVGDSTLRLQLNPVDLGQLSIEISFRDGVMHGKLRAEQGQTLKWLQEGLDGLKARLSDQGIVVQALEVELGQQGDFSQQSGSFSPGPDFGRQRSSRGFFTPDGSSRRAPTVDQDTTIQPMPRDTSGQWAVNVIV